MLGGYFYHKSLRKYTLLLGNLFSNIYVARGENYQRVPITVTSKERFVAALNSREYAEDPTMARVATILPRIGIQMTSMTYDATRKTNIANRQSQADMSGGRPQLNQLFNAVPYDIEFDVTIYTRHQDDAYQIIEQIVPYFQPSFNTMIKELDENEVVIDQRDIPILLESVTPDEELEGAADANRHIEWNLSLRMKGWLYPPTNAQFGEIRTIYLDFTDNEQVIVNADREAVGQGLQMMWNVQQTMATPSEYGFGWRYTTDASSTSFSWIDRQEARASDTRIDWKDRKDATRDLTFDWKKYFAEITAQTEFNWMTHDLSVDTSVDFPWTVRQEARPLDYEFDWNTRNLIQNESEFLWMVQNTIQNSVQMNWIDRQSSGVSEYEAQWNLTNAIEAGVTIGWNLTNWAQVDLDVDWATRSELSSATEFNWTDRLSSNTATTEITWRDRSVTETATEIDWRITDKDQVSQQAEIVWGPGLAAGISVSFDWNVEP